MKKACLSLISIIISIISFSQNVQFGAKAGLNVANFTGSDALADFPDKSSLIGLNIGAFIYGHDDNGKIGYQVEAVYSQKGTNLTGGSINLGYIDLPLLFKYAITKEFSIEAGPQFSLLLSASAKSGNISQDIKSSFNNPDFSLVVGFANQFTGSNIGIDVRYNLGLTSLEKTQPFTGIADKVYNSGFQLGLFYMFDEQKK